MLISTVIETFFDEGRIYLYKAGTVREVIELKERSFNFDVPEEVYREALRIVTILDEVYGADRDIDNGDGGFVLIAQNIQDIPIISERYVRLDGNAHEAVELVKCSREPYINALYLSNNEFGMNILMPVSIAPRTLLEELKSVKQVK
jgi:hypothetical protein